MYLWCSKCQHAASEASWHVQDYKYGVCPHCGASAYRNAVNWLQIAAANGYPELPLSTEEYPLAPLLF